MFTKEYTIADKAKQKKKQLRIKFKESFIQKLKPRP